MLENLLSFISLDAFLNFELTKPKGNRIFLDCFLKEVIFSFQLYVKIA